MQMHAMIIKVFIIAVRCVLRSVYRETGIGGVHRFPLAEQPEIWQEYNQQYPSLFVWLALALVAFWVHVYPQKLQAVQNGKNSKLKSSDFRNESKPIKIAKA